jgi:hypothetical protein
VLLRAVIAVAEKKLVLSLGEKMACIWAVTAAEPAVILV